MLRSLRARLIVSHMLPLLIVLPLAGIALVYVLERQAVVPGLERDLAEQAVLVGDIWSGQPRAAPQALADRLRTQLAAGVMLIDPSGVVLATTDPAEISLVGKHLDLPELATALQGQISVSRGYNRGSRTEVVAVLAPVRDPDGTMMGLVRLTRRETGAAEQFRNLRLLIGGVVLSGLLIGAAAGWLLALGLERPLKEVTLAVDRLARGDELEPLQERGPAEIQVLVEAVNCLVERLRSLQQGRRQLLANLVHELGRPLGALQAATQALRSGASMDPALERELLAGMDGEIGRLRYLLDHLAHLHDQVIGVLELSLQPTALSDWLPPVLAPWREAAREKGLSWTAAVPQGLPSVRIDPDRLAQAIGNLLSNAIKYTPAGGSVSVTAGVDPDAVWIRVSDTGPGIPAAEQGRIFEPFYRGHSVSRFPEGMGLGLAISRDLAEAHGGRLAVQSTPGAGTRFTLYLPLEPGGDS